MRPIPTNQLVNSVGQYMYKHIDGAYKSVRSSNNYDVYFVVYYQLRRENQIPGRQKEGYNDMHEMHINVNLTTYQNKIRVNIHELTPENYTFGYLLFTPDKLQDIQEASKFIFSKVIQKLEKRYEDYDFIY